LHIFVIIALKMSCPLRLYKEIALISNNIKMKSIIIV
jgi:hypothetical protein